MKNTFIVILLISSTFTLTYAQDCINEVVIQDLSLKFCLDEGMATYKLNATEMTIVGHENNPHDEWVIRLSADYNSEKKTAKELWQREFGDKTHTQGAPYEQVDSSFTKEDWEGFLNYSTLSKGDKKITSASAVMLYHQQYYKMITISSNDSLIAKDYFLKVLNRMSFEGEPELEDDMPMKLIFEAELTAAIKDSSELDPLTLSVEKIFNQLEGEDRNDFIKDSTRLAQLLRKYNSENKRVIVELNSCDTISVHSPQIRLEKIAGALRGYNGRIFIDCDGTTRLFHLVTIALKDRMYLAMIRQDE